MAQFIPEIDIMEIANPGEREVARNLSQLSDDWRIFYSYRLLYWDNQIDHLNQDEIDFLLFNPQYGLVVLEVKGGGAYQYDSSRERWYRDSSRTDKSMIQNPFAQVQRNFHNLKDAILQDAFHNPQTPFPCPHACAVVFPMMDYEGDRGYRDRQIDLFCQKDLPNIEQKLLNLLKTFAGRARFPQMTPQLTQKILNGILPQFNLVPSLLYNVDAQNAIMVHMTARQQFLIELLAENPRVLIKGGAGTGKTMMGLYKAKCLAAAGKKTLFLCYNKNLEKWLTDEAAANPDETQRNLLDVRRFHSLCEDFCREAGIEFLEPEDKSQLNEFYNNTACELLDRALEKCDRRYDVILVDEGQDFQANWWPTVCKALVNPQKSPLYVFYDSRQNLFRVSPATESAADLQADSPLSQENRLAREPLTREPSASNADDLTAKCAELVHPEEPRIEAGWYDAPLFDSFARFTLSRNCRNSRQIGDFCSRVIQRPYQKFIPMPEGPKVEIRVMKNADQCRLMALAEVQKWNLSGISMNRIVILSPLRKENSSLKECASLDNQGRFPLVEDYEDWKAGRGIFTTTIRGFKGLEADAVLLIDIDDFDKQDARFSPRDLYVGASRAKILLKIIVKTQDMADYLLELLKEEELGVEPVSE